MCRVSCVRAHVCVRACVRACRYELVTEDFDTVRRRLVEADDTGDLPLHVASPPLLPGLPALPN